MNLLAAGLAALLVGACAGEPRADTTLVISSDPELREMVAGLLPDLARRSGLELRAPVRVERRSREELERYLVTKLDEEMSLEHEDLLGRSYALLGLMPADMDLRALLLSVYTEQVAGFYDPDSTALFVLDDQPAATLVPLLVHELVHAVQDQSANLDSLTNKDRGNDRTTAAQAAIEGHATLVMLEHMMEEIQGQAVDFSEMPDFAGQLRPALQAVRGQYPALAAAPRVIQESILFPYLEGAGFVQALWTSDAGRPAPFGEWLPQSSEQVLDPSRLLGPVRDAPTDVSLTLEGASILYGDALGQFETVLLLEELVGPDAGAAARGWDGDRYALVDVDGADALVWVSVWDDTEARDGFVAALTPSLGRLSPAGVLERTTVAGRPVAVLRVGYAGAVGVTLDEGATW